MIRQLIPMMILVFLNLSPLTSSQSCICNELLAVLEELEHCNHQVVSTPTNQSSNISAGCAQIEELNSTIQQGLQEIRSELQERIQSVKEELQGVRETIKEVQLGMNDKLQEIQSLLSTNLSLDCNLEIPPAHSCKEIYDRNTSSTSGYYWLKNSSKQEVQVYCDMERTCGGVQGGWMEVISINMSNTTHSCPSGLKTLTSPKRLCAMNNYRGGCSSANLDVHGVEYSRVCGKIIGYQQKSPDAFVQYYVNRSKTIDDVYVDGISLTHGQNPRKHIWTFAAALHEVLAHPYSLCPCTNINNQLTIPIPHYVGNDYFCDTASSQNFNFRLYLNDPLWDGQGCGPLNTCCSFNSPPWFMKQLPASTHDNIEMRLCADQLRNDEDIVFEILELYVQ